MVFCFQAQVSFTSANRRDQVLNAMDAKRQTKLRFGIESLRATETGKTGPFGIHAELRFMNQVDLDDFVNTMLAFAVGQFAPVAGSWYRVHDCPHDGVGVCSSGTLVTF